MGKLTREIPSTELVERALTIARALDDEVRAWGALNDVYGQEVPAQADWNFLLVSSSLTCEAKYVTGTVAVNTGATAVSFTSATIPAALDGGRIKFNDNPNVYSFARLATTSGTITPALSEDKNISGGAFTLYQPVYTLPEAFNRFPKNGGLQTWQGGRPTPIEEVAIQDYYEDFSASPSRPIKCRLVETDSIGRQRIELGPPPDKAYVLPMDYLYNPPVLRETTGGVCTVNAGSSAPTFQGAVRLAEVTTGMFFRVDAFGVDADSEWYRIIGISQANSTVTLQTAFALSGATSANYTICSALLMPMLLQGAVLHGVVKRLLADQNDQTFIYADSMQSAAVHDAKRLYRTRTYNQEIDTVFSEYHYRR